MLLRGQILTSDTAFDSRLSGGHLQGTDGEAHHVVALAYIALLLGGASAEGKKPESASWQSTLINAQP
jgi:hypothetical protein